MSNENKSISQFELNLIFEFFSHMKRQGPGSPEATLKALSFIDNLTPYSRIADIGCGTGGQTMILAQNTAAEITGIDLSQQFIDIFNSDARQLGIAHRVKGIVGSMEEELPFHSESLDLIWSEGAICNIGFEQGLNKWKQYLKSGGYIAASEPSWFTDQRPEEIYNFWMEAEPGIDTIPHKVAQMQKAGYIPVATFLLPDNCWTEHYFAPQAEVRELLLKKYKDSESVKNFISFGNVEEELFRKYSRYYGYAFYIGRKI